MPVTAKTFPIPQRFRLSEFATTRFDYRPGNHLTILAPTDWGKTYTANILLDAVARPKLPALIFVPKPRDSTAVEAGKRLGMRRVQRWPLAPRLWRPPERGWMLWPRHTFDIDADERAMYYIFRDALQDTYKRGNRIAFVDEPLGLMDLDPPERWDHNLVRYLLQLWRRGRSMGAGLWTASQRPVDIPYDAYSQAEHLFIGYDPDKRARDRYAEIGGVDPDMVKYVTARLQHREWLYIRRRGQRVAILTPDPPA
jgi:hypothetical protein